jgi:hypothetical protein
MGSLIGKGIRRQAQKVGSLGGVRERRKRRRQLEAVSSRAQEVLVNRLDSRREQLASVMELMAGGLESATRRLPAPFSRQAKEAGDRVLRGASTWLREGSAEDLVRQAQDGMKQHPGLSMAGLLGVGVLAGRMLRASGVGESAGRRL